MWIYQKLRERMCLRPELQLLVIVVSVAAAQTPVPARPTGYVYQSSSSPEVVIEAFYDLLCVDSKANWPILKEVFENFSDGNVAGLIHIFPLPYHHNAYFMQQASVVVRQTDLTQFIKLMELVFLYQDMFLSGAVNMTEVEVQKTIASFISENFPVDYTRVMEGFSDSVVTMDARYAWKYAASRAVTGTPQFIVNGVIVPTAPSFSLDQWTTFISSIINTPTC